MSVDAVLIAGPTASGKSAAALALAERIDGAIINADSMQAYREAEILTARPRKADLARAPHLLYGHVSVSQSYSIGHYRKDAAEALATVRAMGRVPIFVGGTGLYFSVLTHGLADIPAIPREIRESLRARRERVGAEAFHAELASRDPSSAQRLRASDTTRTLRAYEVFEATGRPLGEWQRESAVPPLVSAQALRIVLTLPREELYRRIDRRFGVMMVEGALDEAARLRDCRAQSPAAKILGLRELWSVLDGRMEPAEAISAAQRASRHYAKRQTTWFRNRMADWRQVDAQDLGNFITRPFVSSP